MRVTITLSQLQSASACDVYLKSPEWDAGEQSLVYSDWDATVTRLLAKRKDTTYLGWLVGHHLVPMTQQEFQAKFEKGWTPPFPRKIS